MDKSSGSSALHAEQTPLSPHGPHGAAHAGKEKESYAITEKDMLLPPSSPSATAQPHAHAAGTGGAKEKGHVSTSMAALRFVMAMAVVLPAAAFTVSHSYFLHNWKGGVVIEWLGRHSEIPIALALLYVSFVFISPAFITEYISGFFANSEVLKCFIGMWNLFFSVFSCLGFVYSVPFLWDMVFGRPMTGLAAKKNRVTGQLEPAPTQRNGSFVNSLCYWNAAVFQDGMAAFWLLAFDLSKIVEMMDTVFLVLKGKKVLFLHWYHHLTVMLFCWHAHVTYISNGLWFAVMNMGIHAIMYFYYFCFSCGLAKLVKPFAPFITVLQILQMMAGLVLQVCTLVYYVRLRAENARWQNGANCDTNVYSLASGLVMYASFLLLFLSFFARAYGSGGKKDRRGASGESRRGRPAGVRPLTVAAAAAPSHSGSHAELSSPPPSQTPRVVVVQTEE